MAPRRVGMLALLSAACLSGQAPAADPRIQLAVRIPAVLKLKVLDASSHEAVLEVLANVKAYDLRFDLADADAVAVEIHGLGPPLVVGREGGVFHVANRTGGAHLAARYSLRYTVFYRDGAEPPARRLPLRISAQVS